MENVTSELDKRFSDPGAEPTSWEETERALREAQLSGSRPCAATVDRT